MKPLIAIALSGGIDSLMAAHILKEKGHDVFGIHFVTGYEDQRPVALDALKTRASQKIAHLAEQLKIEVKLLDCSADFQARVVDYFKRTYQAGRTPNPCMVCNPAIKFGTLLTHARKMGAHGLATGHYARVIRGTDGAHRLFRGVDHSKDQSYFLARMTPKQLALALFPLGELTKSDVRALARKKGLTPAVESESQDVCFIRGRSYGEFLASDAEFETRPGVIEDLNGNILGEHRGLHLFTVGQRRGINCPAAEPYYVVKIDREKNRITVGFKKDLLAAECSVSDINWIHRKPDRPLSAHTRLRYRHTAAASTVIPTNDHTALVRFKDPQPAVTPGQGAVFYQNDEVLGGGWIDANP